MDFWLLVAIGSAILCACSTVFNVWFLRRGPDAELKSDVEELGVLVERLSKASRRERMARVRQGEPVEPVPQGEPTYENDLKRRREAIRRKFINRGG